MRLHLKDSQLTLVFFLSRSCKSLNHFLTKIMKSLPKEKLLPPGMIFLCLGLQKGYSQSFTLPVRNDYKRALFSVSQSLFLHWWPFRALEEGRFLTSRFLALCYPRKTISWTPLLLARSIFPPTSHATYPPNLAVLSRYSFLPRRWKQHVPPQRWYISTRLTL
jgi:hypothetical protein